jgi:hypothetical protein
LPFRIPVELVRGGMAFGDAKGWEVEGMVVLKSGGRCEAY